MQYFEYTWRNKFLTTDAQSIEEMARILQDAADELRAMHAAGVQLELDGGVEDDYAHLVTSDPEVAARFGFEPEYEEEYVDGDEDGDAVDEEEAN